jgi:CheY-like chemotaxis protein
MKKILLVDDNADNLDVLAALFEDEGFLVERIFTAKNIEEKINGFSPQLIFMDVMLGAENGVEECIMLKKNPVTSGIKIVLMTASNKFQSLSVEQSLADHHLEKPFDIDNVASIAHRLTT